MAYAVRPTVSRSGIAAYRKPAATRSAARRGFFSRLFDALLESREQEAQRIVASHLARTGYRFTDSIERELNERLVNGGWNARR